MPPDPPRGELAKLIPSPSPVTLHYSPATTFLNENPGLVTKVTINNPIKRKITIYASHITIEAIYNINKY